MFCYAHSKICYSTFTFYRFKEVVNGKYISFRRYIVGIIIYYLIKKMSQLQFLPFYSAAAHNISYKNEIVLVFCMQFESIKTFKTFLYSTHDIALNVERAIKLYYISYIKKKVEKISFSSILYLVSFELN